MRTESQIEPTILVIFGGTGDLTWRKLVPALFSLFRDHRLPGHFAIIVLGRGKLSDNALTRHLLQGVNKFSRRGRVTRNDWTEFSKRVHYQPGDYQELRTYTRLTKECMKLEKAWGTKANLIFYMATPPSLFGVIPKFLDESRLAHDRERTRIVVEKPIGHDLASARELNVSLSRHFAESQIFRIDHYLGKETVQNILAFRFANPMFEPIWNRRYIEYVAITAAERAGIENRSSYYDGSGAVRDMVQNHLMQLLCLVAMEPMVSFEPNEIRNKKVDVLHAVRPIPPELVHSSVARGQYGQGTIGKNRVRGYRQENGVPFESQTETFVALRLFVDNWRWQGVPFYLRTGKRLAQQVSEVVIVFRETPHQSFPPEASLEWRPSQLVMCIQPNEGIILSFQAKFPGPKMHLQSVDMRFNYREAFSVDSPEAYETLLWDVMSNDATLFMRADQVEAAWLLLMPVIDVWGSTPPNDFPMPHHFEVGV
jgi:glucose-6-phosphate 1-dehydrogenase